MAKDTDYFEFEGKRVKKAVLYKTCDNGKTVEENAKDLLGICLEIKQMKGLISKSGQNTNPRKGKLRMLKEKRKELIDILRGKIEFEMKEDRTIRVDGKYKIAQIIRRKCSEKLQPSVRVGQRYFIVGRDKTKNGAEVVVLADVSKPTKSDNIVTIRCNSQRFEWKEFTQAELVEQSNLSLIPEQKADIVSPEEAQMKIMQKIAHETKVITGGLTPQEQLRVSFVPLVINNLAWMYADKAKQCAARDRISLLKAQSRELKNIADEYDRDQREILDTKHVRKGIDQARMCADEMQMDLTLLYYSVNSEFKKIAPDYPYDEMRSYAIISVLFIRFLDEWNKEMDKFLNNKFKGENFRESVIPPSTLKLRKVMKAFAGVENFDYDELNITTGMKVIKNRIRNIEFSIV